jgi:hypothetical protein
MRRDVDLNVREKRQSTADNSPARETIVWPIFDGSQTLATHAEAAVAEQLSKNRKPPWHVLSDRSFGSVHVAQIEATTNRR